MKKMKKLAALLLALAMTLALCACGQQAGTPSAGPSDPAQTTPASDPTSEPSQGGEPAGFTTIQEGKLVMSTNAAFPPYEMTTDAGGFEGIDVEVADAIAKKLGLELVVDDMGFDAALTAVQTGQSDIAMAGITITDERKEVMDFSDSYATGIQVVIVPENSPIKTVDDLLSPDASYIAGVQRMTTGDLYLSDTYENGGITEDHVTAFDTGALAVMALVNGQVDAVVIDNEPAKAFVEANNQ